MQRTVLFLGAGASRDFGYPLTADIFGKVRERLGAGDLFRKLDVVYPLTGEHANINAAGYLNAAMHVLRAELEALFPGILASDHPFQITELLSLLDHLIESGSSAAPGLSRERLTRLRILLERAVAEVVTEPENTLTPHQRELLNELVGWIVGQSARKNDQRHLITVITTNYDLAVEKPLTEAINEKHGPTRIDYGFGWRNPLQEEGEEQGVQVRPANPAVAFYKLHGSINWLKCPLCDHVYLNELKPIFGEAFASRPREKNTCSCGHWPLATLLVAPSIIRDVRDPSLLSIWKAALEAMRRAERWVVAGYSLPSEDVAIRSLMLRASRARNTPLNVEVYQKGEQPELEARYRLLLEEPANDHGDRRRTVTYNPGRFEAFIKSLKVNRRP